MAIITALVAPSLVGFCALGGEMGYWYYRQRTVQAAADIAAFNGAVALRSGSTAVTSAATTAATSNDWASARGTIVVNDPPASGSYQNAQSVEVILTENEPRTFTSIFTSGSVPMTARAVASYTLGQSACMLGLDKSASGAVTFWGNASADFTDCNIVSDSLANDSFKLGGSASVTTPCISSVGGSDVSATLTLTSCTSVTTHAPPSNDPYSSVPAPPIPATCSTIPNGGPASPGKYCNGLSLSGTLSFNPGVYVISGGTLKINANANISGSGVMFYLTNGATLSFNGNANMNLSAATSGTYKGLLFYGDRTQANATNTVNGNASSQMTGAIYFPSQQIRFLGNFSGNNGCLQVVADTIYYTGSATFRTDCSGAGMTSIPVPGAVALVE